MTFHEALIQAFGGYEALDERKGWDIVIKNDLSIYDYTDFLNELPDDTKVEYALEIVGIINDYQKQEAQIERPIEKLRYDLETLRRLADFLERADKVHGEIGGRDVFGMRVFFDTVTSDLEIIKGKNKTNTQLINPTMYYKGGYTKKDIQKRIIEILKHEKIKVNSNTLREVETFISHIPN